MTKKERRHLSGRMGRKRFDERLLKEDTRELKFHGCVRICPMRLLKGALTRFFKITGLWKRGHREFLNPVVRHNTFELENLDPRLDGLTILHLSDLHLDLDTHLTPVLIGHLRPLNYDVVVITGDFNNFTVHMEETALDELRRIMPVFNAPVYGVLGNHDSLRDIPALETMGVRMLVNESVAIAHHGATFVLSGIDDPNIFKTHDLHRALPRNPRPNTPHVLLSHSPCIHREAAKAGVDIVLCGHTHGGQICLPGGRMLLSNVGKADRHFRRGCWREGNTQGWTSSGVGACGIPIRLNCPPEIVLHHLAPASPDHHDENACR